jgi:hypothetical protein
LRKQFITYGKERSGSAPSLEEIEQIIETELAQSNSIINKTLSDINLRRAVFYKKEHPDFDLEKIKEVFASSNDFVKMNSYLDTASEIYKELKLVEPEWYYHVSEPYSFSCTHWQYIDLPPGCYELTDIEEAINSRLGMLLKDFKLSVNVDKTTLKCILQSTHTLFGGGGSGDIENSVAPIFGFAKNRVLEPKQIEVSDSIIQITKVNAVKIECNIIRGAYSNGEPVHTLHEFYPTVAVGYKIVEVPRHVIYLPITVRTISNISVRIVNQYNHLVGFHGETITLRLHIKKLPQ